MPSKRLTTAPAAAKLNLRARAKQAQPVPLTFRCYLENIRNSDASAREILIWGDVVADAKSLSEALAALRRVRRLQEMGWGLRFLWQDYRRSLVRLERGQLRGACAICGRTFEAAASAGRDPLWRRLVCERRQWSK